MTEHLKESERIELVRLSGARKSAQSVAMRARAVLLSAEGLTDMAVSRQLPLSHASVGKWRKRFIECGISGLTDAPRSGSPRSI